MMLEFNMESVVQPIKKMSCDVQAQAANYLRQSNTLILLSHISSMLLEVQNHRGASMAVLSGSEKFVVYMDWAQQRVSAYVCLISQLNVQAGEIIPASSWEAIDTEWQALNHDWRQDEVLSNFEFHSHLIDCLLKMMGELSADLSKYINQSMMQSFSQKQLVLHICLKVMPELIENIAKLRGLSTYLCVIGESDERVVSRLNSLQQQLNINKEGLRKICKALPHNSFSYLPALAKILLHEHKLGQLQQLVQSKVLETATVELSGERLFAMATEIMQAYYQVVTDGLTCLQQDVRNHWLS